MGPPYQTFIRPIKTLFTRAWMSHDGFPAPRSSLSLSPPPPPLPPHPSSTSSHRQPPRQPLASSRYLKSDQSEITSQRGYRSTFCLSLFNHTYFFYFHLYFPSYFTLVYQGFLSSFFFFFCIQIYLIILRKTQYHSVDFFFCILNSKLHKMYA